MIYNDNDVLGEIFVQPNNTMRATYTLYAVDSSDIYAEIEVSVGEDSTKSTELSVRAIEKHELDVEIDIKYRGISDVLTEIQPIGHINIPTEIEVRSGNRMWALYEVQEPPKVTDIFIPFKDALTRERYEFQSINYGNYNSLTVGRTENEAYRSYMQFDFTDWNSQFITIESKLRLHYSGVIPEGTKLELFTVDEQWFEYGITHLNRPPSIKLIVDEYNNYPARGYVEFDFTEVVKEWVARDINNHGFVIKLADDSVDSNISFRSRETNKPPELIVTYYDARIYSAGRSHTYAEIFVWNVGNSDVLAEIEVDSVIGNSDVPTELYVHRYEVPVPHDIDTEIAVTREKTNTELIVSLQGDSDVLAEFDVRIEGLPSTKDTEITVSKPFQLAEIFIAYTNEIDTELIVQKHDKSDILTEISVTREYIDSEIFVKYAGDIETEIEVQRYNNDDKLTEISITREKIYTEIIPRIADINSVDTEIQVQQLDESCILTEISVTRESVHTEIVSRVSDDISIDTEIYTRAVDDSNKDTELAVTRDYVYAEIIVTMFNDTEVELFVKYRDNIDTEITIKVFDQIPAEINILKVSKTESEITVTRPVVPVEIIVPFWDDSDTLVEILPRILRVSDASTEIVILGKRKTAYVFII